MSANSNLPDISNKINSQFVIVILVLLVLFVIIIYSIYIEKSSSGQYYEDSDSDTDSVDNDNDNDNNSNNNSDNRSISNNNSNNNNNNNLLNTQNSNNLKDKSGNQVYNIGSNVYTYDDARAVCNAHSSKLATREQVIEAYKKGADWCNYGWSENQEALFPTQKESWDKLQKLPKEHRNDCGNVGVNGGYFENPKYLFGANCYGKKPNPKKGEIMKSDEPDDPLTQKSNLYKEQLDDIKILPFNPDKWSQYQ